MVTEVIFGRSYNCHRMTSNNFRLESISGPCISELYHHMFMCNNILTIFQLYCGTSHINYNGVWFPVTIEPVGFQIKVTKKEVIGYLYVALFYSTKKYIF